MVVLVGGVALLYRALLHCVDVTVVGHRSDRLIIRAVDGIMPYADSDSMESDAPAVQGVRLVHAEAAPGVGFFFLL